MKRIAVLLRYPKVERSAWKRTLVDQLLEHDYEVSLVFGESSLLRHAKAALKQFGPGFWKQKREIESTPQVRLYDHFQGRSRIYKVNDLNGLATEKALRGLQPDLLLLLGTGIIRKNILEIPLIGTVHCHHGYLPDYRGVNTIEWSIYHGQDVYISTHFVNPGIDTGDILYQEQVALSQCLDIADVRERCKWEVVELLLKTVNAIRDGTIVPRQQTAAEGKQYFTMHPFFIDIVNRQLRAQQSVSAIPTES